MNLISNSLRLFFGILILSITSTVSIAQTGSYSPYSRYGIGDIVPEGFTVQSGMGGFGAAYSNPFQINFINPASYIADSNVVFDFGAKGEIRKLQSASGSNTLNNATFSHFSLAFPVVKGKMSATFGLLPFSSVGYNVVDTKDKIGRAHV